MKMKANEVEKALSKAAEQPDFRSKGMRGETDYGCNRPTDRTLARRALCHKAFVAAHEARQALRAAFRPNVVRLG